MPASAPSPTTSQRAASSAPPAGGLPPTAGITCPSPQKTPTTRREILVALGGDARCPGLRYLSCLLFSTLIPVGFSRCRDALNLARPSGPQSREVFQLQPHCLFVKK